MRALGSLLLLTGACGGDGEASGGSSEVLLRDYHGLEEGSAWTYRDDGSIEDPVEAELVRARSQDGEFVELRRGLRWTESEVVGHLEWDLSNGLELVSWDLLGHAGEGGLRMADFAPENGDRHATGAWVCTTNTLVDEVDTFYAVFDDLMVFQCAAEDAAQPAGDWTFAKGMGLVRFESADGVVLDLVAPY